MKTNMKELLYASSVILLIAACLPTGLEHSPVRYLFFPVIIILAYRISSSTLLKAGFTFSLLFAVMAFSRRPPDREITNLAAEVISFFVVTIVTCFILRRIEAEKERGGKAAAAFAAINSDLNQKSQELQTALDALSKAHRHLQATDHSRRRFLADVSHELRTPLTSIRSYSEILLDYEDIDNATRREFVQTINDESERMTLLVSKYLDLLRTGEGKAELSMAPVNPRLLLEVSIKVVMPMAERKGLPLVIDLPAGFPEVTGDQNRLTQVLVNLLNNAVKFTAKGKITAGARMKDGMAEFYVADTGEGIFPEEKEVIFDEFYRISESLPDRPSGSGLGLAIARQIVEQHGGRIWVDSAPGKGSTFYFTVPVFTEEQARFTPEPLPVEIAALPQYEPILVQSESIVIRQSVRKLLESHGYRTFGADTPKRGVDVSSEVRPGLIISDNLAEREDFQDLGNWARDAGVKIILVNLYVNPASGELGVVASGYFKKPLDRFQILSTIERFVSGKGRFFIISPIRDEARKLQMLLGAEGYTADLYSDETEALKAALASLPNGIIIGSFTRGRMEDVIAALKREPHCARLPFFLLADEGCCRFSSLVSADTATRRLNGKGPMPLLLMIEKSFAGRGRDSTG